MTTQVLTAPIAQRWPNGEVPYEIPFVWAANDALLTSVDAVVAQLNCALLGHLAIRPRRPGDRDYLVLRVTSQSPTPDAIAPGCHGGVQDLRCLVGSFSDGSTPIGSALIREFLRALGIPVDFVPQDMCPLNPCIINSLKHAYPEPHS